MLADYIKPNWEERLEKLEQAFQTPFSPPDDVSNNLPLDYPTKDSKIDSTEWYQEGYTQTTTAQSTSNVERDSFAAGFIQTH